MQSWPPHNGPVYVTVNSGGFRKGGGGGGGGGGGETGLISIFIPVGGYVRGRDPSRDSKVDGWSAASSPVAPALCNLMLFWYVKTILS